MTKLFKLVHKLIYFLDSLKTLIIKFVIPDPDSLTLPIQFIKG